MAGEPIMRSAWMSRTRFAGVIVATCWAVGMLTAPGARAEKTASFTTSGCTTWTVPAGVNRVLAEALGAAGHAGSGPSAGSGGDGDEVYGDVPVSAGEVLDVCVDYGGGPGGLVEERRNAGSGGGASGIARGENFSAPLIVAGGGGGGGERSEGTIEIPSYPVFHEVAPGGNGGRADSPGEASDEGKGSPGGKVEGGSASNSAGPGRGTEGGFGEGHSEIPDEYERGYDGAAGGGGGGYVGGEGASYPEGGGDPIGNGGGAGGTNFCDAPGGCVTVVIPFSQTGSVNLDYFEPPKVTLTTPPEGATYTQGEIVDANYSCEAEAEAELTSCVGTVPDGSWIPTSTTGPHSFTVTATQEGGEETSVTHTYTVAKPPEAIIESPASDETYGPEEFVPTTFSCKEGEGGTGIHRCEDGRFGYEEASPGTMYTNPLRGGFETPKEAGEYTYTVNVLSWDGSTGEASIKYKVLVPASCSSVSGHGVYKKVGETGRLKLDNDVSTGLTGSTLHVRYESGKDHFRLVKLSKATCTGAEGARDFQGEGEGAIEKTTGYTLKFSIYEEGKGKISFKSKLMKGAKLIEASGGPLSKSTEKIS